MVVQTTQLLSRLFTEKNRYKYNRNWQRLNNFFTTFSGNGLSSYSYELIFYIDFLSPTQANHTKY